MSVAMSDHVLLLEKVVAENKALWEQMKQMADNDKRILGDLHKKIVFSHKTPQDVHDRQGHLYEFQNSARYVYVLHAY